MEARDDPVAAVDIEPAPERVGAMLRARRIELGLSQADVASIVKLPPRRIESMEEERWNELPDGPYLRGFLRNVARALNLDAAMLIARVDVSAHEASPDRILVGPGVTNVALPRRSGPADDRRGGRTLVYGAFAFALLAALIAWSGTDSFDRTLIAGRALLDPSRHAATPAPTGAPSTETRAVASTDAPGTAPAPTVEPTPATAAVASTPPAATPATSSNELALLFHFNDKSWIEVRSADGKVIQRLNEAGSDLTVDGEAPFTLVVGNAKGVALRFRGQPVDLAPYTRDAVARFKLS